jgi:AmmeMemoRadiSam system protein B
VAGSWYPATGGALAREVDDYLDSVPESPEGEIVGLIAPHAGLMFSGPVGAYAYKAVAARPYDVAVLVGPSHFVGFEGVAVYPTGAFDSPLGLAPIDEALTRVLGESPLVHALPEAHRREHSLEMQLPFLRRILPDAPIVPLLMGYQDSSTIRELAAVLGHALRGRRALLVASTDLSHYFDAATAARLDGRVRECVAAFDTDTLMELFEGYPEHERGRHVACGGGPMLSVMMAARELGARHARVLKYAHSGEVSGDYEGVVGYLAAVMGNFTDR